MIPRLHGALFGLVSAATAVGVGEFVAGLVRREASPVVAVGNRVIELTPGSTTRSAIDAAGTNDKVLLIGGILVLLAAFGVLIGVKAVERLRNGLIGVAIVGALGVYCALSVNAARVSDAIPALVATLASAGVLTALVRVAERSAGTSSDRRRFLVAAGAGAGLAAATGFGGRVLQAQRFDVAAEQASATLPGRAVPVPTGVDLGKSTVPWRTPNATFYRIDTSLVVPQVSKQDWRLRIHGMVDKPLTIDFDQLMKRAQSDHWITLNCVSNTVGGPLIGNALWRGALLADLLREAGLQDGCEQLMMTSVDGMTIGAPTEVVMDGRPALLAVGMNGHPLPVEHGYPVRVVVPGLYGYVSACKWITSIEATTYDKESYWTDKGWGERPDLLTSSRIDRPASGGIVDVGSPTVIAGVAWDQHVGVSKVEVRINDDPWRPARLAKVPTTDTWRQWVLPWTPEKSGEYRLTVRATDAKGTVQTSEVRDPYPAASSGLHTVMVRAII